MKKNILIILIVFVMVSFSSCRKTNNIETSVNDFEEIESIEEETIIPTEIAQLSSIDSFPQLFSLPSQPNCYPETVSSDGFWIAGTCMLREEDMGIPYLNNIFVISVSSSEYFWLLSEQEVTTGSFSLHFSPDNKYLSALNENGLWLFETANWESRPFFSLPVQHSNHDHVWTPDSKSLFFYSDGEGILLNFSVDSETYESVLKTSDVFQGQGEIPPLNYLGKWGPAFHENPTKFLYLAFDQVAFVNSLNIRDLQTGETTSYSFSENTCSEPFWLSDGGKVAIKCNSSFYVFDLSANSYEKIDIPISEDIGYCDKYSLSPDKTKILMYGYNGEQNIEVLYMFDSDSDTLTALETGNFWISSWLEDSQHVYVVEMIPTINAEDINVRILQIEP